MGRNDIISTIASFVKPAWQLADKWQFWAVILSIIGLLFCIFVLYPVIIWLLWQAGRLFGMIGGG